MSPGDWPTPSWHHEAQVPTCSASWVAVATDSWVSWLFLLPPPSPPPFRSHCFLRPLSLFLYHRLIHPATRALSRPVSYPAAFRGDESRENRGREGGRDEKEEWTVYVIACVMCSWIRSSLPGVHYGPHTFMSVFYFACLWGNALLRGKKGARGGGFWGWRVHREAKESSLTWLSHCAQIQSAFPATYCVRACVYMRVQARVCMYDCALASIATVRTLVKTDA